MNRQTFNTSMAGLAEYYGKQVNNASFFDIYWRKVKHLNDNQFTDAVDKCIDECKFFPRVSEILERVQIDKVTMQKGSISWCDNTQRLLDAYSPSDWNAYYEQGEGAV